MHWKEVFYLLLASPILMCHTVLALTRAWKARLKWKYFLVLCLAKDRTKDVLAFDIHNSKAV